MQLLRLRRGYTFEEFRADVESGDLSAIRRLDREAIFYGGMPATRETPGHFGVRLGAGQLLALRLRHTPVGLPAGHGCPTAPVAATCRPAPIDMVMRHGKHRFATPTTLPSRAG